MSDRPGWFDGSIIGAVFTLIVMPAVSSIGIGSLLLNIAALACFVVPVVAAFRDGDVTIG